MVRTIKRSEVDSNNDKRISQDEWNSWLLKNKPSASVGQEYEIQDESGKKVLSGSSLEDLITKLHTEFAEAAAAESPADVAGSQLKDLEGPMNEKLKQFLELGKNAEQNADALKQLREELAEMSQRADFLNKQVETEKALNTAHVKAAIGEGHEGVSVRMQMTDQQGGGQTAMAQTYGGGSKAMTYPGVGSAAAQTLTSSLPQLSSDTYLKAMVASDNTMNSWDQINQNQNRGKQLLLALQYFMKMAESGELSQVANFMKVLTYIITKDKAKQVIEMGKKLIQLQELSRQWTNKLMGVSASATDAASSNELMKTMTIVKSETDSIATSQKLISQMIEEFGQVAEVLTTTWKGISDVAGRTGVMVARMS